MIPYFSYDIKSIKDTPIEFNDEEMKLCVSRIDFDKQNHKFNYRLSLVINREISVDDSGENFKNLATKDPDDKYVHFLHFPKNSLSEKGIEDYSDSIETLLSNFCDRKKIDTPYYRTLPLCDLDEYDKKIIRKFKAIEIILNDVDENNITGYGIIGFSNTRDGKIDFDKCFIYHTEFYERPFIKYSIKAHKNYVDVIFNNISTFKNNQFSFKTDCRLYYSDTAVYKTDIKSFDEVVNPFGNKKQRLYLPNDLIGTLNLKKYHFLLSFVEEKTNHYFYLCLEDDNHKVKNNISKIDKKIICPCCKRPLLFKKNKIYFLNQNNEKIEDSTHVILKNKKEMICLNNVTNSSNSSRLVEIIMPTKLVKNAKNNINISIFGVTATGKSVFFSSLLGLQNGVDSKLEYLNNCFKNNKIDLNFNFEMHQFEALYVNKYSERARICQVIHDDDSFEIMQKKDRYADYSLNKDNIPSTLTNVTILPFILKSNKINLIFKDIAGEVFTNKKNINNFYDYINDDAFIILIDPNEKNLQNTFTSILNNKEIIKNKPIAIVFTKFDSLMVNSFSSHCALSNDEISDLINIKSYAGSNLEKNINRSSLEIESYLLKNKDFYTDLDLDKLKEFNIKFFVVSSIGLNAIATSKDKQSQIYSIDYYSTPYRIEVPILWLMAAKGVF